jgi:peptidoglycan DL-endopeptidase CwlO
MVAGSVLAGAAVAGLAGPAAAQPGDEGGTPTLGQALEAANRGYLDAQAALDASKRRQAELNQRAAEAEKLLAEKTAEAAGIAATAYRTGPLSAASAMLDSASPDRFVDRAMALKGFATRNDRKLRELNRLRRELASAREKIDAEVTLQEQQVAAMAKQKQETEKALAAVGGRATGGYVSASSPLAKPAPRRPDGSWPPESCTIDDPTTGGCLTPRMLHALQQAKAAGFTRYVACHRPGGPYEHPKGRACDFAAQASGFGGVATGGDRVYGNNLAAYFVRNANQLGVLYTIWFEQIWTPAAGWRAYRGGGGDPSSDHTNHVHVSVY